MDRRKFIKNSCTFCIGTAGLGLLASSCGTTSSIFKTSVQNNQIIIPLSEFATKNYVLVRSSTIPFDIFAYKKPTGQYVALLMKCSHRDAAVQYTSGGLVCNEHGSRFNFEGEVTKEPASNPLTEYMTSIVDEQLIIKVK